MAESDAPVTNQPEVQIEQERLKYLEFVQVAAIHAILYATRAYGYAKDNSVIDKYRTAMKSDITEALICTNDWMFGEDNYNPDESVNEIVSLDVNEEASTVKSSTSTSTSAVDASYLKTGTAYSCLFVSFSCLKPQTRIEIRGVFVQIEQERLKYLEFVQVAAIHAILYATRAYGYAKDNSVIDKYRTAMKSDITEALICTKDWMFGEDNYNPDESVNEIVSLDVNEEASTVKSSTSTSTSAVDAS
ncbi:hypothetical protein LXL04_007081 [Taraxacum kok-saghyz]